MQQLGPATPMSFPGYHYGMATVAQVVGAEDDRPLRTISSLLSIACTLLVYELVRRRTSPRAAFFLTLPFALSPYVIGNAVWLMTDLPALLFVALAMAPLIQRGPIRDTPSVWFYAAVVAVPAAVAVRQVHVWLTAVLAAFVIATSTPVGSAMPEEWSLSTRWRPARICLGVFGALVAILLITYLFVQWGNLSPTSYPGPVPHPAVWTSVSAQAALFGGPMLLLLPARAFRLPRPLWFALGACALATALLPSSFSVESGRWGGWLWSLTDRLPQFVGRSPLMAALSASGTLTIALLGHAALIKPQNAPRALILLSALAGFIAAHAVHPVCFQRYYEPFVLMWCALCAALAGARARSRWRMLPLFVLSVLQFILTLVRVV